MAAATTCICYRMVVWRFFLRGKNSYPIKAGTCQTLRGYSKSYKQPWKEKKEYAQFRREVSRLRRGFLEEWREGERMAMETMDAQAAEEAREEQRQEEMALEENRLELERMAQKRALVALKMEEAKRKKREAGEQVRLQKEEEALERRREEVRQVQIQSVMATQLEEAARCLDYHHMKPEQSTTEESAGFITLQNLDEKIKEALQNEVEYNFALSESGQRIYGR